MSQNINFVCVLPKNLAGNVLDIRAMPLTQPAQPAVALSGKSAASSASCSGWLSEVHRPFGYL